MNRIVLTALFVLAVLFSVTAQTTPNYCGTPPGKSEWLKKYQAQPAPFSTRSDELLYIPLTIHIVGTSDGKGYYGLDKLYPSLCTLNEDFLESNIQFYIKGEIDYINSDSYYDHDFSQGSQMMNIYNIPNTVNCYFVDDPAGTCGYYSPWRDAVAIGKNCASPQSHTWAHELGHFFSLPHTFSGWEGTDYENGMDVPFFLENNEEVELKDGSNCVEAGDGFCDTPADYLSFRWTCNSEGVSNIRQRDPVDSTFRSDGTFIMSYSNNGCMERFSAEQMEAMRANILSERNALPSNAPDPVWLETPTTLLSPVNGDSIGEVTDVLLEWEAVPGAEGYNVDIGLSLPGLSALLEKRSLQTNTNSIIVEDIQPLQTYGWTVKAFNRYDGCSPAPETATFTLTNALTSTQEINNDLRLQVYPQPAAGGAPLTVEWRLAESNTVQLSLFSTTGQLVRQKQSEAQSGLQRTHFGTQGLATGLYLLEMKTESGQRAYRKVVLQ